MTSSKRLTKLVETVAEADGLLEILEGALKEIPTLIFLVRATQALAVRELREAGEDVTVLLGDRGGVRTLASPRQEAEG